MKLFLKRKKPKPAPGEAPPRVFRLPVVLGLMLLAIGLAWFLIPRQYELVGRLVEDGRHERALALVEKTMAGQFDPDSAAGEDARDATAAELVRILIDTHTGSFDEVTLAKIEAVAMATSDPAGVREVLDQRGATLPKDAHARLLERLAVRAVQTGDPSLGADIYEEMAEIHPLNLEQTRHFVESSRFSASPKRALQGISAYLETYRIPFTQLPEDLRRLAVSLHREVNEVSEAFDLLSEEFKATLDPVSRKDMIELLNTLAAQSNRIEDSLPLLMDYLNSTDAGARGFADLASRQEPHPSDADFLLYGKTLALHLEWNSRTSDAFELYRKLALLGDLESLDRCVTIYPWISRQGEITDLLAALGPVSERPQYTLLLARFEAERGDLDKAAEIFKSELEGEHARDAKVWMEYGDVLDARLQYAGARDAYRSAVSLDPRLYKLRIKLARLHVTLGDYDAALLEYRQLTDRQHDRKTREDYAMLADALGATTDFTAAMRLKLASDSQADASYYLDIAESFETGGDFARGESCLLEGIEKYPKSRALALRLSDHYAEHGEKEKAFALVARAEWIKDNRVTSRLLSLGYETSKCDEALALMKTSGVKDAELTQAERLDLAAINEEAGELDRAIELFGSTKGGEGDAVRLRAERAYLSGNIQEAWSLQKQYIDATETPDYEAWTVMGDLHRAIGRTTDAEVAYQNALDQLKVQLQESLPFTSGATTAGINDAGVNTP